MGKLAEIRTDLTAKKKKRFLRALLVNHGNITKAHKSAGVSRQTPYDWRDSDTEFALAWENILLETGENLEQEAYRRAHDGVEKPVYQGGQLVGRIREYSDTLLIFMLKARFPEKYTQVQKIAPTTPDGKEGIPLKITLPENWGKLNNASEQAEDE